MAALNNGEVLLLENVRFYKEEEKNDPCTDGVRGITDFFQEEEEDDDDDEEEEEEEEIERGREQEMEEDNRENVK